MRVLFGWNCGSAGINKKEPGRLALGQVRKEFNVRGMAPSRHVRFTADYGSADEASGLHEFMTYQAV
jgi:hypothetical protein